MYPQYNYVHPEYAYYYYQKNVECHYQGNYYYDNEGYCHYISENYDFKKGIHTRPDWNLYGPSVLHQAYSGLYKQQNVYKEPKNINNCTKDITECDPPICPNEKNEIMDDESPRKDCKRYTKHRESITRDENYVNKRPHSTERNATNFRKKLKYNIENVDEWRAFCKSFRRERADFLSDSDDDSQDDNEYWKRRPQSKDEKRSKYKIYTETKKTTTKDGSERNDRKNYKQSRNSPQYTNDNKYSRSPERYTENRKYDTSEKNHYRSHSKVSPSENGHSCSQRIDHKNYKQSKSRSKYPNDNKCGSLERYREKKNYDTSKKNHYRSHSRASPFENGNSCSQEIDHKNYKHARNRSESSNDNKYCTSPERYRENKKYDKSEKNHRSHSKVSPSENVDSPRKRSSKHGVSLRCKTIDKKDRAHRKPSRTRVTKTNHDSKDSKFLRKANKFVKDKNMKYKTLKDNTTNKQKSLDSDIPYRRKRNADDEASKLDAQIKAPIKSCVYTVKECKNIYKKLNDFDNKVEDRIKRSRTSPSQYHETTETANQCQETKKDLRCLLKSTDKDYDLRNKLSYRSLDKVFTRIRNKQIDDDETLKRKDRSKLVITIENEKEENENSVENSTTDRSNAKNWDKILSPSKALKSETSKGLKPVKPKEKILKKLKYRKKQNIKLVIKVIYDGNSETSSGEEDAVSEERSSSNDDVGFLDDLNVDEIVKCINDVSRDKTKEMITTQTNVQQCDCTSFKTELLSNYNSSNQYLYQDSADLKSSNNINESESSDDAVNASQPKNESVVFDVVIKSEPNLEEFKEGLTEYEECQEKNYIDLTKNDMTANLEEIKEELTANEECQEQISNLIDLARNDMTESKSHASLVYVNNPEIMYIKEELTDNDESLEKIRAMISDVSAINENYGSMQNTNNSKSSLISNSNIKEELTEANEESVENICAMLYGMDN